MVVDAPPFDLTLRALRARTSEKWRRAGPDVLPLWVAEMDVASPPAVREVLVRALERGDTGYASGEGYAEAYADFARARWGSTGFDPSRSALVPDVMRGVSAVLRRVTEPLGAVVVTPPVYPPFFAVVEDLGRSTVEVPLTDGGRLDLPALTEAFARAAAAGRSAFLLCSPHNPTGTVHTRDELAAVAAAAEATGVRVVADEIHAPLVLGGARFTPYLDVPGAHRGLAVVSASKGWNLPGLKAGLAFAGPEAGDDLVRLPDLVAHGASHFGVLAHTAALREGGAWLDEVVAGIARNRALLGDLLSRHLPSTRWTPGEATYLAWLDLGDLVGLAGPDGPAAWLLEHARVMLSAGADFGRDWTSHARLNFATSASVLEEAVRRMAAALEGAGVPGRGSPRT